MHTLSRETVSQNIPLLKLKVLQYLLLLYFLGICKMKNEIETKRNERTYRNEYLATAHWMQK